MAHKYFGEIMKGKTVVISGSTGGLGLLMARRFLECGAKVAVMGAPTENIEPAVQKLQNLDSNYEVLGYQPNLSNAEEVGVMLADIVAHWGKIDVLINNAGIYPTKPFEQYPQEMFERVFDLNVTGCFVLTQEAVKYMKQNENGGSIINTSSMAGVYGAWANIGYTASKFAVEGMTLGLSRELGKYKIRVNAVAPASMFHTDIDGNILPDASNNEDLGYDREKLRNAREIALKFAPMGNYQSHPDEEINAFIFLASDAASFISGQTIVVSGACVWPAASPAASLR